MSVDNHELTELVIDLRRAPARADREAPKTLRKAARLVNKAMRVDAAGHEGNYFGRPGTEYVTPLPQHVSDELLSPYVAEIGIEAKGAGKLAHILAYGSANNAPAFDPTAGLRRSTPAIVDMFAESGEESVLGKDGKG